MFDVLKDSGLTVDEIANRIHASLLGTERLLDAAVSLGLLHKLKCEEKCGEFFFWHMHKLAASHYKLITCKAK